jgi:hypothetical protein
LKLAKKPFFHDSMDWAVGLDYCRQPRSTAAVPTRSVIASYSAFRKAFSHAGASSASSR